MAEREEISLTMHPVFGALTRPAMTAGVTFEYHCLNLMLSVCAFIALGNLLYGLMFIPIHVFGWFVCRNDSAYFIILYKRLAYLPPIPNKALWGVRAYEPY